MSSEEEKLLSDAKKWPWEDRLAHKLWKVRIEAYCDLAATCEAIKDPKDARLREFGPLFKKAVADSNAPAQEKALDALLAFQVAADAEAGRYAKEICDTIAAKCLTGRTKTVEKSIGAFLYWVELEAVEAFLDAMEKAVKNKVAKAVVPAIDAVYQALSQFGAKVVPPKRVLKLLPDLFNHADQNVRAAAKGLTVELCKWIGKENVTKLLFEGLRDATKLELEAELDKVNGQAIPTRKIRSEQAREEKEEIVPEVVAKEVPVEDIEEDGMDAYEMCEPVDIMVPLSKTSFWDGVKATKWSERRDAVAELTRITNITRIAPGDYSEVCRTAKKLITDVNIAVTIEALQAVANLAKGLRKDFSAGARMLLPILLEKFKEKKQSVLEKVREALQAMFIGGSFGFVDMLDDVKVAVKNKVPSVRSETLSWLCFCIEASKAPEVKKVHKDYVPIFMEGLQDGTPDVRDAAFLALVAVVKAVGMRPLEKSVEGLDEVRKKKLAELIAASEPASAQHSAGASSATVSMNAKDSSSNGPVLHVRASAASLMSNKRPGLKVPGVAPLASREVPAKKAIVGSTRGDKQAPTIVENVEAEDIGIEILEERLTPMLEGVDLLALRSAVWKERLEAMVSLKEKVASMDEGLDSCSELIVRFLSLVPGWGDKNVQVMQKIIEVITLVAEKTSRFTKKCVVICLTGICEKCGDIKTRAQAVACLSVFCEASGPQFVFDRMYTIVKNNKNPKVLTETLTWLASAIDDFSTANLKIKDLIDFCKDPGLSSSTAACRNAAIKVLGVLHKFVGPDLKDFLGDVKPALMAPIEAEFEKNPYAGPPTAPKRAVKGVPAVVPPDGQGGEDRGLPREDISLLLTATLIESFSSPNWKVRQESIEAVNVILEDAHKRIEPTGTGELFSALKGRLNDSNKNLIISTLISLSNLVTAIGPNVEKSSRGILADILKCLTDPKKQCREAVVKTLDAWVAQVPLEKMVPYVSVALTDPKLSADGRKDVLDWLPRQLLRATEPPELLQLLKPAAACLQDKNSEVRKADEIFLAELVRFCGYDLVARAARSELSSAGQAAVAPIFEKLRSASSSSDPPEENLHPPKVASSSRGVGTGKGRVGGSGVVGTMSRGASASSRHGSSAGVRSSVQSLKGSKAADILQDASLQNLPLLNLKDSNKDEREKAMPKGIRVKFEEPRPEHTQELEIDMAKFFREDVVRRLVNKDFKAQIEGLNILQKAIPENILGLIEVLDLLLRWIVLRFCESNTTGLLKVLEFLPHLVEALKGENYVLSDVEASLFIPCLIEKSGHNIANVREQMRELVRLLCLVYPVSKLFSFISEGLRSKNNRSRIECVDHMEVMMERHGVEILGNAKAILTTVAMLTTERDSELRKAALNMLATAYKILGEDFWRHLGKISEAQKGLVEDKCKWKAKEMEKRGEGRPGDARATTNVRSPREELVERVDAPIAGPTSRTFGSSAHKVVSKQIEDQPIYAAGPAEKMAFVNGDADASVMLHSTGPADWADALEFIEHGATLDQVVDGMKMVCHEIARGVSDGDQRAIDMFTCDAARLVAILTDKVTTSFSICVMPGQSSRPCKYVLNTLMQVFQVRQIARAVQDTHLRALMAELLLWLLDDRVPHVEDGMQLLKATNVLMLKILDNTSPTVSFVVLISLLQPENPLDGPSPVSIMSTEEYLGPMGSKFSDLVVKCLIKLTKALPATIQELDLDTLLFSIHIYFEELGLDEQRRRMSSDDKPLRMVKTVLYELVKVVGPSIKSHLTLIPADVYPAPSIVGYIDYDLQAFLPSHRSGQDGEDVYSAKPPSPNTDSVIKGELVAIFTKIGNKATSLGGLNELYYFTIKYPQVDIYSHLTSVSEAFRSFIRDGLQQVEVSAGVPRLQPGVAPHTPPAFAPSPTASHSRPSMASQYEEEAAYRRSESSSQFGDLESPSSKKAAVPEEDSGKVMSDNISNLRSRMSRIQVADHSFFAPATRRPGQRQAGASPPHYQENGKPSVSSGKANWTAKESVTIGSLQAKLGQLRGVGN